MPLLIILILFIGIPIAEITVLIKIGGVIGIGATIALVLATAIIGTVLIRHQGLKVINQVQTSMQQHIAPVDAVIHGVFLLLAGALLLTPGFITDLIGFLCLVPPLRLGAAHWLWSRMQRSSGFASKGFSVSGFQSETSRSNEPEQIIEGEFTQVIPEESHDPDADSPWAKKD